MKLRKVALIVFIGAIAAFFISYLTAPKKIGEMKQVSIQKELSAESLEKLQLRLEPVGVEFMTNDSNVLTVDLQGHFSKDNPLEIEQNPGEITLTVSEDDNFISATEGHLRIGLPVSVRDLQIELVSGDIAGNISELRNLNIASVSGNVRFDAIRAPVIKIATVSGDVDLNGELASVNLVSVSGDVRIATKNAAPAMKMQSKSGDIKLKFAVEPDVTLNFKTMSGDVKILGQEGAKSKILGKGTGSIEVETISGDLEVQRM